MGLLEELLVLPDLSGSEDDGNNEKDANTFLTLIIGEFFSFQEIGYTQIVEQTIVSLEGCLLLKDEVNKTQKVCSQQACELYTVLEVKYMGVCGAGNNSL